MPWLESALDLNLVLDLPGGNTTPGTFLQVWPKNTPASSNQSWALESVYFCLVSALNPNLVLDVAGGNTPITANQLWVATQSID